jgi:hypothetical protein
MIQGIAGLAGVIAVVAAAFVGRTTFDAWLNQKRIERKLVVGEEILSLAYEARDKFRSMRNPAYFGGELDEARERLRAQRPDFGALPEGVRSRMATAQAGLTRIHSNAPLWENYFKQLPAARIHFGEELQVKLRTIWQVRAELSTAFTMYGSERHERRQDDFNDGIEAKIWGIENDPIDTSLLNLIRDVEAKVLPLFRDASQTS